MRILYISQYFPPEVGATQTRAYEMAIHLIKLGHRVVVLTEFSNHPKGIIPAEDKGKFCTFEKLDGIPVVRAWVYAKPKKNFLTRMVFYLSFMLTGAVVGSLLRGPFDVVYATSPPFFVGVAGLWLSRLKSAKFVFEVRDLWPRSAVELNELTNRHFIRWSEKLERFYYKKADKVIAVTKGIFDALGACGLDEGKVKLVRNGTNSRLFSNRGDALKERLGGKEKFIVLYAGIFGLAQGMEQLCELVGHLSSNHNIHFVFIGEGPLKARVLAIKEENRLDNLTVLDEVPRDRIPDYISAADCCLVPLKKNPLFLGALPSKMFDCMACERPVILSVDGEARRVLEASLGGLYVEPENTGQMAEAILTLFDSPELCKKMGKAGRAFVSKNFSRKKEAQRLANILEDLVR
jgi:glycosyltransferase involved in cell wall biosynthesis